MTIKEKARLATRIALIVLAIGFAITAVAANVEADLQGSYSATFGHRFASDNAYGATANAVEHLAKHYPPKNSAPWFIASLLCWLILSVERVRAAILATRP